MSVSGVGEMLQVSTVRFGSTAAKARIEQGYEIVGVKVPTERINAHWFYIPGLIIACSFGLLQGLRIRRQGVGAAA